jgi:hypothetical protein
MNIAKNNISITEFKMSIKLFKKRAHRVVLYDLAIGRWKIDK